ncbi:helix-turn-helix domain-containing protein [Treponema saccharophilum]|uniref:Helix-turn-helix domain protein n=1 Tax=Treponema saccharophilum DSM 2985 TaxID=907348 RepID=H7EKZ0_9SPIR|nr:helix-turn-helix transcriptional regulator [Treponema saccharophilum]EIC01715.1 helix-turn-helix domain protein [Treponema saccharophilum DSM 2985]BDC97095.1 transcriptional regulator [Treponema saccharophilum]
MTFRETLREEISYQGITLKELAEKSGVPKRTLESYVDARARIPTAENAVKIAKSLNVTVEYLVTGVAEHSNVYAELSELQQTIKEILSIPHEQFKPIREIIHNTADLCRSAVRQGR